jgi:hypothetical protein
MRHIATFLIVLAITVLIGVGGLFAIEVLSTLDLLTSIWLLLFAATLTIFIALFLRG